MVEINKLRFPCRLRITIGSQSITDGYTAECAFNMYFYSINELKVFLKEISESPMYLEINEI